MRIPFGVILRVLNLLNRSFFVVKGLSEGIIRGYSRLLG